MSLYPSPFTKNLKFSKISKKFNFFFKISPNFLMLNLFDILLSEFPQMMIQITVHARNRHRRFDTHHLLIHRTCVNKLFFILPNFLDQIFLLDGCAHFEACPTCLLLLRRTSYNSKQRSRKPMRPRVSQKSKKAKPPQGQTVDTCQLLGIATDRRFLVLCSIGVSLRANLLVHFLALSKIPDGLPKQKSLDKRQPTPTTDSS